MTKKYIIIGKSLYFINNINEPLDAYYDILVKIFHITFYDHFDYPIVLTRNILSLNLGTQYNHLLKLPSKFTSLSIYDYSRKLELNKYIKNLHISLGYCDKICMNKSMRYVSLDYYWANCFIPNKLLVKLHIDNLANKYLKLPKYLTHISICSNSKNFFLLPSIKNIVELKMDCHLSDYFVLEHSDKQIRISIYKCCDRFIDNLPNNSLTVLEISKSQLKKANNLPSNLIIEIHN